jgi:hypothetical protein
LKRNRRNCLTLAISATLTLSLNSETAAQRFPASIDLGSLDGRDGFRLDGETAYDRSGFSVAGAGDVNGDGIDDFIIGAPSMSATGKSYLVFGRDAQSQPFPAAMALSSLDGSNGFKLAARQDGNLLGFSVSGAGDINGDGIDDLIIGAPGSRVDANEYIGISYVVFGRNAAVDPFPETVRLSRLGGLEGFALHGEAASDLSGISVSNAGDMNGDGIDDLVVGARSADPNGSRSGRSYVIFGSDNDLPHPLELSTINGLNGFMLDGESGNDQSGFSVSAAGDINGDGIDDLIVGAPLAAPNGDGSGRSYVVFGSDSGLPNPLDLSSINGPNGLTLDGEAANDRSGISVSNAGDINGDGIEDLVVGAHYAGPNSSGSGRSYVVFGSSSVLPYRIDLSDINGLNGFMLEGETAADQSGRSVGNAGDVNGDGIDDLIIGAFTADPNGSASGRTYVVFGSDSGLPNPFDLSSLDGLNGFTLDGEAADNASGFSVAAAGDVNGDGIDDLIIGAFGASPNGSASGSSYVVFGRGDALFADRFEGE